MGESEFCLPFTVARADYIFLTANYSYSGLGHNDQNLRLHQPYRVTRSVGKMAGVHVRTPVTATFGNNL